MNDAKAQLIRRQARVDAIREVARTFRAMPWWKRWKLALFARWY